MGKCKITKIELHCIQTLTVSAFKHINKKHSRITKCNVLAHEIASSISMCWHQNTRDTHWILVWKRAEILEFQRWFLRNLPKFLWEKRN